MCGGKTFPSDFRLLKAEEFRRIRESGRKIHTAHFVVYVVAHSENGARVGITVSRKVGNSVKRNRVKRLVREFFRLNRPRINLPVDISIIAKRGSPALNLQQVSDELAPILISCGPGTT